MLAGHSLGLLNVLIECFKIRGNNPITKPYLPAIFARRFGHIEQLALVAELECCI